MKRPFCDSWGKRDILRPRRCVNVNYSVTTLLCTSDAHQLVELEYFFMSLLPTSWKRRISMKKKIISMPCPEWVILIHIDTQQQYLFSSFWSLNQFSSFNINLTFKSVIQLYVESKTQRSKHFTFSRFTQTTNAMGHISNIRFLFDARNYILNSRINNNNNSNY